MKPHSHSATRVAGGLALALAFLLQAGPVWGQAGGGPATPVWRAKEEVKPFLKATPPTPTPASVLESLTPSEVVRLEAPDLTAVLAEDKAAQGAAKGPKRIGIKRSLPTRVESARTADGSPAWRELKDGRRLRVFTLESAEAVSVRIHFEGLALPTGATLLVFNADNPTEVRGPYDLAFAGGRDEFWSESIFGSRVTVECLLPAGMETAKVRWQVREIIHSYVPLQRLTTPAGEPAPKAGACNNDVTCFPDWAETSRAVAGLGTIGDAGFLFCTGCLVADTDSSTFIDYFLTANHCVGSQEEANTLEFYWFYQTPTCNGVPPAPANVPRTGGGADYLAGISRDQGTDFTFLHLRQEPPANVAYAGWSSAPMANNESVIVVHHPDGDFKRISFGNHVGSDSDFWEILWNNGTTEAGSSGSPLFNVNHEIVGQLYGGLASCTAMTETDFFGRFDVTFPQVQGWLLGLPPANDAFANATLLAGSSGVFSQDSNVGATKEPGEPNHAGNPGGHSVWFRWTAPSSGPYHFDTWRSRFDTTLAVYTGSSLGGLTEVASNNDSVGTASGVNFNAVAGTTYSIAVDGFDGAYEFVTLSWAPWNDNFAEAFGLTGAIGSVTGLNVGTSKEPGEPNHANNVGGRSVWYRWTAPSSGQFRCDTLGSDFDTLLAVYTGSSVNALTLVASNDDAVGMVTASSLVTFDATAGTTYSIAVDGYDGDSGSFSLTWYQWNDNFANAVTLSGSNGDANGFNSGATRETGEPVHPDNAGGASIWYRWTAPASGTVTFDTEGSGIDTLLAVYTGASVGGLTLRGSNDDIDTSGGVLTSRVTVNAVAGTTYQIAVDGYGGANGYILLTYYQPGPPPGSPPANNSFAAAQALTGSSGTASGYNRLATKETGEPNHAGTAGGKSIWYRWTAPSDGQMTIDTIGCDFDSVLAVYTGGAVNNLTELASNDDFIAGSRASQVTFAAVGGTAYQIAVDGYRTDSGTVREGAVTLNWAHAGAPTPPSLSDPQVLPNGQFRMTVNGVAGQVYTIESSSTLSGWNPLGTITNTSAATIFTDTSAPGQSPRFYRAGTGAR